MKQNTSKTDELKYTVFETAMGWIGILGSAEGLLGTTLPQHSAEEAHQLFGENAKFATLSHGIFEDLTERFKAYFSGKRVTFPDRLDFGGATAFRRGVWERTRLIPYGETRSYLWIAESIGKAGAARGVGQALARNPLPIVVPCHRVVTSDGGLGGFRGGLEMKRHLLWLEASAGKV
ncbi:MAG: methylated-DNA--[protein]-cysteine S-methyltransferase [Chloroflexi bacterium]|nr:methylated-DNA--[protein]-cysteine S-methyltransferase [Chloroflexota bacterium]